MNIRKLKNALKPLVNTPLHPQWLAAGGSGTIREYIGNIGNGKTVLDIGCFDKWPSKLLPADCTYIGLDYYQTATEWYGSTPDVFGDACNLPIRSASMDAVLLLDVLEHLVSIDAAFLEIGRVLKPDGSLILQMPFLYPLHDEPRDFTRLSRHGFVAIAERHGLVVEAWHAEGAPIETAALLANIAISKLVLGALSRRSPVMIFSLLAPILIISSNLLARAIARLTPPDDFMPYSYQVLMKKVG